MSESASESARGPGAPLFRVDPGWLFVLAGLVVCAAGVLMPAQADLHTLRQRSDDLQVEESRWYARLKAHADFIDRMEREEPDLIRRLAAAQLNMIPSGETPVLLAASNPPPVTQWIDGTVTMEPRTDKPLAVSTLSRLANGPDRLWLFAGGIMCVFIGLMLGPGLTSRGTAVSNDSMDYADGTLAALEDEDRVEGQRRARFDAVAAADE